MLKGLEVPEKVENLLKDKKAAEEFAKGGGSIVQNNLIPVINFAIL